MSPGALAAPRERALQAASQIHACRLRGLTACLVAAFGAMLLVTGWLSDDAQITLRTIDNALHGHGLRWNVAERVQAFTHPLWLLLLLPIQGLTGDTFVAPILVGAVTSLAAVALVARLGRTPLAAALAVSVLAVSKAFVDFSTSGLENPLVHVLLALFAHVILAEGPVRPRRQVMLSAGLVSLLVLCRHDAILLVLPASLLVWGAAGRALATTTGGAAWRRARALSALASPLGVGLLPLLLWESFSLAYYGFPFPNTAYTKLGVGIAGAELAAQGLHYLLDSLTRDPITLAVIAAALAAAALARARMLLALGAGLVLHVGYVILIGGDFMSGRFLTAPLLVAVVVLLRSPLPRFSPHASIAAVALAIAHPQSHWRFPSPDELGLAFLNEWGIADERRLYGSSSALSGLRRGRPLPAYPRADVGRALARGSGGFRVRVFDQVGALGLLAGPAVHVVDPFGLGDPLLARLPALPVDPLAMAGRPHARGRSWRIGHFARATPTGYIESLRSGRNQIAPPATAHLYDDLALVTRAPLWSLDRWRAIARLNLDGALVRAAAAGQPPQRQERPLHAQSAAPGPGPSDAPGTVALTRSGLLLEIGGATRATGIEVVLGADDDYVVELLRAGQVVWRERVVATVPVAAQLPEGGPLVARRLALGASARDADRGAPHSFDAMFIQPVQGDGLFHVGRVRLLDAPSAPPIPAAALAPSVPPTREAPGP